MTAGWPGLGRVGAIDGRFGRTTSGEGGKAFPMTTWSKDSSGARRSSMTCGQEADVANSGRARASRWQSSGGVEYGYRGAAGTNHAARRRRNAR